MRKKSNKELGVLLPECMVDAIRNDELSDAQAGMIVRAVVTGNMDIVKKDVTARLLAKSFAGEYRMINGTRIESIKNRRKRNRESEERRRNLARISEKMLEKAVDEEPKKHMGAHVRPCIGKNVIKEYSNNTPHISPQGGRGGAPAAPSDTTREATPPDPATAFADIWARHPRKEGEARAFKMLRVVLKKNPGALAAIDAAHAAWCATERWTKEGGRFAPRLSAWLADEGWRDEPPQAKKDARPEPPPAKCGMGL